MSGCIGVRLSNSGFVAALELRMGGAMGRSAGFRALGRWAAIAGLAGVAAACGALENMTPNMGDFHPLPSVKSMTPAVMTPYTRQLTPSGPVPSTDLVDG